MYMSKGHLRVQSRYFRRCTKAFINLNRIPVMHWVFIHSLTNSFMQLHGAFMYSVNMHPSGNLDTLIICVQALFFTRKKNRPKSSSPLLLFYGFSPYFCAESRKLFINMFISAFDMIDVVNRRYPICYQTCNHKTGTAAQIGRINLGTG